MWWIDTRERDTVVELKYKVKDKQKIMGFRIQTDACLASTLAMMLAANIIDGCQQNPPYQRMVKGACGILAARESWADHGVHHAFQQQVMLLYAMVEEAIASKQDDWFFLALADEVLITEALTTYQAWKTRYCEIEQEEMGEGFGSRSSFNQKNWADRNDEFLALYKF
jgi:hypothetical protein